MIEIVLDVGLESKSANFQVCNVNVATCRVMPGDIVEMLERRSVNICWVQVVRFTGM